MNKKQLILNAVDASDAGIGRWIDMLKLSRARTMEALEGIDPSILDYLPQGYQNSIGNLLYHIAVIEMDWHYAEILVADYPAHIMELFPNDVRDESGRLIPVTGLSLNEHLVRLDKIRSELLNTLEGMTLEDFRRPRSLPDYDVTPEWVLFHLLQHEAEHRGEIRLLRVMATSNL